MFIPPMDNRLARIKYTEGRIQCGVIALGWEDIEYKSDTTTRSAIRQAGVEMAKLKSPK